MKHILMLLIAVNAIVFSCAAQQPVLSGPNMVCTTQSIQMLVNGVIQNGQMWQSSNMAIGTVDVNGVVTGIATGTTNITYFYGENEYAQPVITVTVNPYSWVQKILSNNSPGYAFSVPYNNKIQLTDLTKGGAWSSSNPMVGTIDSKGKVTGVSCGTAIITYTLANGCYTQAPIVVPQPANSSYSLLDTAIRNIEYWHTVAATLPNGKVNAQRTAFIFPANTLDSLIHNMNCTNLVFYIGMNPQTQVLSLYYDGAYYQPPTTEYPVNFEETRLYAPGGLPVMFDNGMPCPTCGDAGSIHFGSSNPPDNTAANFVYSFIYYQDLKRGADNTSGLVSPTTGLLNQPDKNGNITYNYAGNSSWSLDSIYINDVADNINTVYGRPNNPIPQGYLNAYTFKNVTGPNSFIGFAFDPIVNISVQGDGTFSVPGQQTGTNTFPVQMTGKFTINVTLTGNSTSCNLILNGGKPQSIPISGGSGTWSKKNVIAPQTITLQFK